MDLKELLKKFYDAGIMAEATLEEKYSFEQTLADNSQALQLLQTGVKRCFSDDHIGVIARNIAKEYAFENEYIYKNFEEAIIKGMKIGRKVIQQNNA